MKQDNHITPDDLKMRQSPFSVPEGYFDSVEERISNAVFKEDTTQQKGSVWNYLKPVLLLACSFCLIFGIGYGILSLSGVTAGVADTDSELAAEYAMNEAGYLGLSGIDYVDEYSLEEEPEGERGYERDEIINYFSAAGRSERDRIGCLASLA